MSATRTHRRDRNGRPARHVAASRCSRGCLWLHEHDDCPRCGGRLHPVRIRNEAVLLTHTVVRITPDGNPVRLGVARTVTGATTLCVIAGSIRGNGRDRVRLVMRDGRFYALASGSRLE